MCSCVLVILCFSLTIGGSREVNSKITTIVCGNKIDRLEHVVAYITFDCTRRGEVELLLTSSQGTQSKLLTKRRHDISPVRSFSWKFMSLHYWGENPSGTWSLKMSVKNATFTGTHFLKITFCSYDLFILKNNDFFIFNYNSIH